MTEGTCWHDLAVAYRRGEGQTSTHPHAIKAQAEEKPACAREREGGGVRNKEGV
jgi:hypothetical protein